MIRAQFFGLLPLLLLSSIEGEEKGPSPDAPLAQVRIDFKIVELRGAEKQPVGFDWHLGQRLLQTHPNPPGLGVPRPETNPEVGTDAIARGQGVPVYGKNNVGTITGILTDPQFRVVTRAIENRPGTTLLATPSGLCLSATPLSIRRPDGWNIEALPVVNLRENHTTIDFSVVQTGGDYAGLQIKSRVQLPSGHSAVFSDTFQGETKGKNKETKKLLLLITPTILPKTEPPAIPANKPE